mgnify:CR=1 FL=1
MVKNHNCKGELDMIDKLDILIEKAEPSDKEFIIDSNYQIIHYSKGFKPLCYIGDEILVFKKGDFYLPLSYQHLRSVPKI